MEVYDFIETAVHAMEEAVMVIMEDEGVEFAGYTEVREAIQDIMSHINDKDLIDRFNERA